MIQFVLMVLIVHGLSLETVLISFEREDLQLCTCIQLCFCAIRNVEGEHSQIWCVIQYNTIQRLLSVR